MEGSVNKLLTSVEITRDRILGYIIFHCLLVSCSYCLISFVCLRF